MIELRRETNKNSCQLLVYEESIDTEKRIKDLTAKKPTRILSILDDPRATGRTILGPAQWLVRECAFDHIPNNISTVLYFHDRAGVLIRVSPTPSWIPATCQQYT